MVASLSAAVVPELVVVVVALAGSGVTCAMVRSGLWAKQNESHCPRKGYHKHRNGDEKGKTVGLVLLDGCVARYSFLVWMSFSQR
jgi:hypothetical protein